MINGQPQLTVSVIVPAYNMRKYVGAAIESALNQTRPAHEIIVVDDGSTDATQQVLCEFGPPVKVIRQPNRGLSAARNEAIRHSTGDAIMFLDADDLLLPNCIERTVSQLEERGEVDVVYSDVRLIDEANREFGIFSELYPGERPCGLVLGEIGYRWSVITVSSTLVRRSALQGIDFDEGLSSSAEDFELWRRLAARSKFLYSDEVAACYRYHSGQITATRARATMEGALEVQRRLMNMPEFADVAGGTQARFYCHHGIRHAGVGNLQTARSMFCRAVRVRPTYPMSYALLALSCLGGRALNFVIEKRRQLTFGALNQVISSVALPPAAKSGESENRALGLVAAGSLPDQGVAFAEGAFHG